MRLYRKRPWRFFLPLFLMAVLVVGMCLSVEYIPKVVLGLLLALLYGGVYCYTLSRRRPPFDPTLRPRRLTGRKRRGPPPKREPEI